MESALKTSVYIISYLSSFFIAFAGDGSDLKRADSLFSVQKYTEAMEIYDGFFREGRASSSMLLKMAFIHDASDDYADALYYLDLYFRQSADRQVIGKIEALADEHSLSGYRYTDMHYFLSLLDKFRISLVLVLLSFSLLILIYIIRKTQHGKRPLIAGFFQMLLIVFLLGVLNFERPPKGIIIADQVLLRSGPSAGAEPIAFVDKGHKVTVVKQSEIWTKILWEGDEAYVRNGRLRLI